MERKELNELVDKSIKEVADRLLSCTDEDIGKLAYSMKLLVETSLQI